MSVLRWIPTFLAFPLGGLLAMLLFGSVNTPLAALGSGLVAGALIGGAQWLALGRAADWRWLLSTAVAMSVGMSLSVLTVGAPVTPAAAIAAGLITGILIGVAQGGLLRRGVGPAAIWTAVVGVAWALGWLITSFVIVDIDRGHVVFGASGAIIVTVITGVVLRLIIGPRAHRATDAAHVDARVNA